MFKLGEKYCRTVMKVKDRFSKLGFLQTVKILEGSVNENGLKVVSIVDAQANLNKIGAEAHRNKILEIFNPKLVKEVFECDLRAEIAPPLRIYIYREDGKTHINHKGNP